MDNNHCDYCGRQVPPFVINENALICIDCLRALTRCPGCTSYINCAFENDPSPVPKTIVKTFQQGPAVFQAQIRNPQRMEMFCQKCGCWNSEYEYCCREDEWCPKHKEITPRFREGR